MPSKAVIRKRGQPVRVRTKKINGKTYRIYVFATKGKRGGKTWAEPVRSKRRASK